MAKWEELIKYLKTTDAKPAAVLKLIKNTWKPKGSKSVRIDDYNTLRRAWKYHVVNCIYNDDGTNLTAKIWNVVSGKLYEHQYKAFNLKAKTKTPEQHFNACKKLWTTSKSIRAELKKNGGHLDPLTIAEVLVPMYKDNEEKISTDKFLDENKWLVKPLAAKKKKK
jgi:hypothetical protein